MRHRFLSRLILSLAVLLAQNAKSCQICVPFPTVTLAEKMMAAEAVVFAREDPKRPFHYRIVEHLKGPEDLPVPDLFVDSQTRRALAVNPEHRVLCVWRAGGDNPGWERIGSVDDAESVRVVRDILRLAPRWADHPGERLDYFAGLLGHAHPLLGQLAYLEVGKANYGRIRELSNRPDRLVLRDFLANTRMLEWHALYILLLARTGHPDDEALIRERVEANAQWGPGLHTAAWATALIEIDGEGGLKRLKELYLEDRKRSPEELAAIHTALRVHGDEGPSELRDPVVALYDDLLKKGPALAPDLADDLTKWKRFEHAGAFAAILAQGPVDIAAMARIRRHLKEAGFSENRQTTSQGHAGFPLTPVLAAGLLVLSLFFTIIKRPRPLPSPASDP